MFYGPVDIGAGIALAMLIAGAMVMMMVFGLSAVLAGWMRNHNYAELAGCISIGASLAMPALLSWLSDAALGISTIALFSIPGWLGLCALIVSIVRRQHWPPGHCHACGYDLRGNREATACPECGAALCEVRLGDQNEQAQPEMRR